MPILLLLLLFLFVLPGGPPLQGAITTLLKQGSYGPQVVELQQGLKTLGYYSGAVDGLFGPITRQAVINFQRDYGLIVDGIVGPQTAQALQKALSANPVSTQIPSSLLKLGSTGSDVVLLQTKLSQLGFNPGPIDGIFGYKTQAAVMKFQASRGLVVDGIVGPRTWSALFSVPSSTLPSRGDKPAPFPSSPALTILGYATYDWPGDRGSYNSIANYSSYLTTVVTFTYGITATGNLTGEIPWDNLNLIKSRGLKPLLLVHNLDSSGFNPDLAHSVLANPTYRSNLVRNLLQAVRSYGYAGVNVDIEGIYPSDRGNYIQFLRELKNAFAPYGLLVTAAIPAKEYDNPYNSWSYGYDYKAIGEIVDQVVIMTYDEHWFGGPPGPVASLPWVTNVVKYAVTQIPSQKILLGIAVYGYDWSATGTQAVNARKVNQLVATYGGSIQWDNTASVPYYIYYKNGVRHEVWFENAYSNAIKFNLVRDYNLGGIAIWKLGDEDADFWQAVKEKLLQ